MIKLNIILWSVIGLFGAFAICPATAAPKAVTCIGTEPHPASVKIIR
jgi:hypothetical protein